MFPSNWDLRRDRRLVRLAGAPILLVETPVAETEGTVSFYQGTATTPDVVTGYQARKGYDLVTGVGTVNASKFVYELAGVPVP